MEVQAILRGAASYASDICAILAFLSLAIKPIRERILGIKASQQGLQSLLRAEIVSIYYRNLNTKTLKEYEYKTMCQCWDAYKANHGNSFVEKLVMDMKEWEIIKD